MYTSKERHEDHPQKAAANNSTSGALSLPAASLTNQVSPLQLKGSVNVNDDASLEKEADIMGSKALSHQAPAVLLSPLKVSQPLVQRQRINSIITGTTHLVQALNGSIYQGTQGRLLPNNTRIEVETSDKIRSRRGPNQESFREYDAQNAPEYRWVRVISVEGEPQAPGTYIRDDTFVGGADIPRGSAFAPALDHRERTQPNLPERVFAPIHAAQWYQRPLGHDKSSTADRKHTKLLSVAFGAPAAHIGAAMRHHAKDADMGIVLETVGQHFSHVTPWTADNVESQGRDRHDGHLKPGEYYRTSPGHPLHKDFQRHQQLLGIYKKDETTEPVNPGWAAIAESVMGIKTMKDTVKEGPLDIRYRVSQSPGRFARGPGAVIGHEEMARETAKMQHALLARMDPRSFDGLDEQIGKTRAQLEDLARIADSLLERQLKVKAALEQYAAARVALEKQIPLKTAEIKAAEKAEAEKVPTADDQAAAKGQAEVQSQSEAPPTLEVLKASRARMIEDRTRIVKDEAADRKADAELTQKLQAIQTEKKRFSIQLEELMIKKAFHLQQATPPPSGPRAVPLQKPRVTDLRPLAALPPARHQHAADPFASRLLVNRRHAKLPQLLGAAKIGPITDRSGPEHPNLVLHNESWKDKEETTGVQEVSEGWKASTLKTDLQVRGSFGHYRPSISPLLNGMIRINPGLYPLSLLQFGLMYATRAEGIPHRINPIMDFIHRDALNVAVNHALAVIAADRPGKSDKIRQIKTFAIHNLMINLLKAQTILKAPIPDPDDYMPYILWLEKDFSKTAQVLENLNESTHLLLSARVNEEKPHRLPEPLLLHPGPFRQFVHSTFARGGRQFQIYYVASGMQAITTGAIAAVHYKRTMSVTASGKAADFVSLHPYFEMKGATAAAAGFRTGENPETIISDLSPLDTTATPEQQSKAAIRARLNEEVNKNKTLVPVLDATAMPLTEVPSMVPEGATNFIIVESLTKYAQLGSDKALGGRIIVVGNEGFIKLTSEIIAPVEQSADIVVSKIWFESMENIRYSH